MTITISIYDSLDTIWMWGSCQITINDDTFLIDLICLPFKNIDMVLGMDWFSYNSLYIGRKQKAIYIPNEPTTLKEVIFTMLEGTINMIHCLFSKDKAFL